MARQRRHGKKIKKQKTKKKRFLGILEPGKNL
jgi:hypothetical protein